MKKSILALAVIILLSACSGGNSEQSADPPTTNSIASPVPNKPEPVESTVSPSSQEETEEKQDTETKETQWIRIDADGGLRMRSGAGTDFDIIKVLPKDTYAELATGEKTSPDWLYVTYDGDSGWISKEFVAYEEKLLSTQVPNWAQIYYDYLDGLEAVRHSDICDFESCDEDWTMLAENKLSTDAIYGVLFQRFPGYDYPVMACFGSSLKGHTEGGLLVTLIENGKVFRLDWSDPRIDTFFKADGGWPELRGEPIKDFDYGNSDNPFLKVFAWLKTQL